jgi:hypothetical protein
VASFVIDNVVRIVISNAPPYLSGMKMHFCIIVLLALAATSCTSIKPYQRAYLNDSHMEPGTMKAESFEQNVFNYREGALQTGGKKGKGGCGCN